jgi:geranylgeranylglycerol-phosphate geranylgeranyltransferase
MAREVVKATQAAPVSGRLADLAVLVRLPSCLAGGASALLGIHLAGGAVFPLRQAAILAMAGMSFAVAAANVVNDIVDVDIDTLGKPRRPLPSGRVSIRDASVLAVVLALAAVAAALPLGAAATMWMIGLLVLAACYSIRFKNTVLLGNAVVALCASSPIVFGALVAGGADALVWTAAALSFTFMLTYETLKTIVDRDSDAAGGIRTFATWAGSRAAVYLFRFLIVLLTSAACVASIASSRPVFCLAAVIAAFVLPAWGATAVLGGSPGERPMRVSVFLMRIAWFLGVIPLWLLR